MELVCLAQPPHSMINSINASIRDLRVFNVFVSLMMGIDVLRLRILAMVTNADKELQMRMHMMMVVLRFVRCVHGLLGPFVRKVVALRIV